MRRWLPFVLVLVLVPTPGCATVFSAILGEAVCGDSDECRSDLVSSGIETDAAIVASAIEEAAASDERPRTRAYAGGAVSSGGEEYDPPDEASGYYHCVDGDGHHVIELIAPSAMDARLLCAAQLGVAWSTPEAGELCSCTSRG